MPSVSTEGSASRSAMIATAQKVYLGGMSRVRWATASLGVELAIHVAGERARRQLQRAHKVEHCGG